MIASGTPAEIQADRRVREAALAALAAGSNHVNQRALATLYEQDMDSLVRLQRIENGLLEARFRAAGVQFIIEPYVRFKGEPGEQATMFLLDPTGNALEFKAFRDIEKQLFAT